MKKYLLLLLLTGCIINQDDVETNSWNKEPPKITQEVVHDTVIVIIPECREKRLDYCLLTPDNKTFCQFLQGGCHAFLMGAPGHSCVKYKIVDCYE